MQKLRSVLILLATILSVAVTTISPSLSPAAEPRPAEVRTVKIRGGTFPIPFRPSLTPDLPQARYPGHGHERQYLRAGTVRREGAMPLPCDIILERDTPIRFRDGTIIYADVFRPADEGRCPAILSLSLTGKEVGAVVLDDFSDRRGVEIGATSGLERYGGPDPAYWASQGYAVVNPDPRGVNTSRGHIRWWGRQYAEDGYDIVEWIALQPWCSGRVAMAGVGDAAVAQWCVAAAQPPHLDAIAPWGGASDIYRDIACRGGIPNPAPFEYLSCALASAGASIEDLPLMILRGPYINAYWRDKAPDLEQITVPTYAATPYNEPGTEGTIAGWKGIASREKWLRFHTTTSQRDLYDPLSVSDLTRFFDAYLKDSNNGWEYTPRVRVAVHDPGRRDIILRAETDFPLPRTLETCLYLDAIDHSLSFDRPVEPSTFTYDSRNEKAAATFTYTFSSETEITGPMSLRIWVAADADDLDLAVRVEKLTASGHPLNLTSSGSLVATGLIRASCRALDESRSTTLVPRLAMTAGRRLTAGEPVPLEIAIRPMAMNYHPGETLRLTVLPYRPDFPAPPFGGAQVTIPRDSYTVNPGEPHATLTLGRPAARRVGKPRPRHDVAPRAEYTSPPTRNRGRHTIYTGGHYDSSLIIPIIPPRD